VESQVLRGNNRPEHGLWAAAGLILLLLALAVGGADSTHAQVAPTLTPSLTITPTLTRTPPPPPLEIIFEGVYSIALEFRQPVRAALEANRPLLRGYNRLTVSAYRDSDDGWAKITLVPTELVEAAWAGVETVDPVEVIARFTPPNQWTAYLVGSPEFAALLPEIPPAFADFVSPLPVLAGEYKFPWQAGQDWWAINGWHEGSGLDFEPAYASRFAVLAAQSGRMREICSDGTQSLLQIQHADGRSTYYLHVTLALSVRRRLLDQNVQRGQYLGELINRDHFVTPCGRGYSRHLHFAVSDRALKIDGYSLESIAGSASCCVHPPVYRSTNQRVDLPAAGA
jgi:murein DD-endopeptidase MepM/ murein hydrolase activator NlpD